MAVSNIGITALELFAYNPYRVLGIPVNITQRELDLHYTALMDMCESGTIKEYVSPFDYDDLPAMQRNEESLAAAYEKLQSNGYRCFAYAEKTFAAPLSQADVKINLEHITSYDCFLSCYMWLVINDRRMTMKNFWLKLAKYIDYLICSSPDEWDKLFDSRFPDDVYENDFESIKSFYTTFCDIILLPLKELVKGSMHCYSALEILSYGILDENEIAYDKLVNDLSHQAETAQGKMPKRKMRIKGAPKMQEITAEQVTQAEEGEKNDQPIQLADEYKDDNIYTETLTQMLKASKAKNQIIRDIDLTKSFGGGNLGKEEKVELVMDEVNFHAKDESLLRSPYSITEEELTPAEKYKDIKIDDMLNPTMKYQQNMTKKAADEDSLASFQNRHEERIESRRKLHIGIGIILIIVGCVWIGLQYHSQIVDGVITAWNWICDTVGELFS